MLASGLRGRQPVRTAEPLRLTPVADPPPRDRGVVPLRLLVADRQALFRMALRRAADVEPDVEVVAEANDWATLSHQLERDRADVVLVDVAVVGHAGLRARLPSLVRRERWRLLVVGGAADEQELLAAVETGADGYLTKESDLSAFLTAVRKVAAGEFVVPRRMVGGLLQQLVRRAGEVAEAVAVFARLTPREAEVLDLLADGCGHRAIADILVISPETARTHIQHVMRKVGVHSRAEAAALALRYRALLSATSRPDAPLLHGLAD